MDGKVSSIPVNDKFIVFKRDGWDWTDVQPKDEVKDAVVIRLQDVFAQSALWTYANEIRAALEVIAVMGIGPDETPMIARLHEIADYFERMSYLAGTIEGRKVPD